jgi:hypothetical protein
MDMNKYLLFDHDDPEVKINCRIRGEKSKLVRCISRCKLYIGHR